VFLFVRARVCVGGGVGWGKEAMSPSPILDRTRTLLGTIPWDNNTYKMSYFNKISCVVGWDQDDCLDYEHFFYENFFQNESAVPHLIKGKSVQF